MTDLNSESIGAAQQAGYDAYAAKKTPRDNPYKWSRDKTLTEAWARGYAAARTDQKKLNRAKQHERTSQ